MDHDLHPLNLDRELARAASAWRQWRRRVQRGGGLGEDPFARTRSAVGATAFQAASELPETDPLRGPLQRWIYRLAEQRINLAVLTSIRTEYAVRQHPITSPEDVQLPLRSMLAHALREPRRSGAWLDAYLRSAHELHTQTGLLWERRLEIARRLRLSGPEVIERCSDATLEVATAWLDRTRDVAAEHRAERLETWLALALGSDVSGSYPRLSLRGLGELLNEAGLLDRLELDPGPLPEALGTSSYLRALARLGAAFTDATAPSHQPFVVAHDPYGLRRRSVGALFAELWQNPEFVRRRLGLGGNASQVHQRVTARVLLLWSRVLALKVVLRAHAYSGPEKFARAYADTVGETLGFGVPKSAAFTLFRLRSDDEQRFCGLVLAAQRSRELIEQHDVDWYRNPRAIEELRASMELSPAPQVEAAALRDGSEALLASLTSTLG